MASKTPERHNEERHGDSPSTSESNRPGGGPRGSQASRDGDGCLGADGDSNEDDTDGDGDQVIPASPTIPASAEGTTSRKKRKKPKKKKKATAIKQSSPPRIPLSELFPSGNYPQGEVQPYHSVDSKFARTTAAESRHDSRKYREHDAFLQDYRKAAEVHRQTRQWLQKTIKPGQTLWEVATGIEDSVRALLGNAGLEPGDGLESGMGFPTGLCLNNQVAHYTPNPGQKDVVLKQEDVLTVDFGVHING